MCYPADMPPESAVENDGRWNKVPKLRDWAACDVCGARDGVRIVEQRVKWGKAARYASRTGGYTGRPIPWCAECRAVRRPHSFRYHRPRG